MTSSKRIKNTPLVDVIAGNEDLLVEILLHLPPRCLLRFKCVSKHCVLLWAGPAVRTECYVCESDLAYVIRGLLISNPQFHRRHSRRNPYSVATALFYYKKLPFVEFGFIPLNTQLNQTTTIPFHFLDFFGKFSEVRNVHSCNGLFCVQAKVDYDVSCFICDPTINQSVELPLLVRDHPSHVAAFNLAFDPSKSPHYRVVCVWLLYNQSRMFHFSIYTSETQLWRHSGECLVGEQDIWYNFKKGVYWNGAIHWVFKSQPFLCFDVDNECFKAMPSTPITDGRSKRIIKYFGQSGGHLHLIEIYEPQRTIFDVLEMEGDYSKWFSKYRIDLDAPTTSPFPLMTPKGFSIFSLLEEKEGKIKLVLSIPGKFILYDLSDMTIKELLDTIPANLPHNAKDVILCRCVGQYIESLTCV
ncbi:F-box protein At5g07610-like [Cornus florida]|uniref:F-box protein At5g07610-like n=1 Tax=Cornus florida TaxID=4283 RepID=UPI0028A10D6C|nr:F-box protein At5g07610-like [Cornus florida]